ncbi:MAG: SusC/RagA family TonB-linked outer membrane protein, partial [Bacteroidaceae bacterium]|nr:SusC/RagA family TonB-linked outer membrane protein [Bacteroidaceae bacterium]
MLIIVCMVALVSFAQKAVTGTVKDKSGEPLIGVSVMIDGTSQGTVTDFDGNFRVPNVSANTVLNVSYIGYKAQKVKVGNQDNITITLEDDNQQLQEVVVVGYGTMKKTDLTGSVSSVNTEDLTAKGASSVMEALQGTVPGVSITKSSGRTGGGFNVEIRGKSSNNSSTTPIYVVDGIICDDIDFLNEQDIERIDVLKDASSTAIYGSRATAGVIIVTTKSGKGVGAKNAAKPTISYDGYYGITNIARMPEFMTTQQFYNYRFLRFLEFGEGSAVTAQSGQPNYMLGNYGQMALTTEQAGPTDAQHSVLRKMLANGQSYDWTKALTQTGTQQNHYLSVSGGAEKINYHMGVGYTGEKGVYRGDEQRRFSLKGSLDAKISNVVSAGFTFNVAYIRNQYAYENAVADAFTLNSFALPYDKDGNMIFAPGAKAALGTDGNQFSDAVNPLYKAKDSTYDKNRKTYRMLGNFYVQITPLKGLVFKSNFQPSFTNYREAEFYDPTEMRNLGARDSDLHSGWTNIKAYYNTHTNLSYIWDNMITWDKTFAEKHQVNVMGLASFSQSNSENSNQYFTDVIPATKWWNLTTGTFDKDKSGNSFGQNSMVSYALRANYTFDSKYMITATIRWDGSSKFADGHRWGSFPSVAVAWRASEESFLKNVDWLSNLKLRVSYGVTGNNKGIGNYATQQTLVGPSYYPFGDAYQATYYSSNPVNKAITWETSNELNFGLDFAFLNSRINGAIDVYTKKSKDLLYNVQLPLVTGGVKMNTNVGSVKNTGVEISLNTVNIITKDWRWETSFTFAHNKNKILEVNGEGTDIIPSGVTGGFFIGHNVNSLYGFNWQGIVSDRNMTVPNTDIAKAKGLVPGTTMRECDYYYTCYGLVEGNPLIEDVNGDGTWDSKDRVIMDADPAWTGSFSTSLSWKGIDLNMSLYAKMNYKAYSNFYASGFYKYSDRGTQHMNMDFYIPQGTLIDCDGVNPDGTYINP